MSEESKRNKESGDWLSSMGLGELGDKFYNAERQKMEKYKTQELGQDNPLPWQKYTPSTLVGTDATGGGFVNDTLTRLNSPNVLKDTQFKNVNYGGMNPMRRDSLGDPVSAALNNKYASQYDTKIAGLKNEATIKDPVYRSKQYDRAGRVLGAVWQNQVANYKEQVAFQQQREQMWQQWKNAQDQAKASFISAALSFIPVIGGAIGKAIGGGGGGFDFSLGNTNGMGGNADQG